MPSTTVGDDWKPTWLWIAGSLPDLAAEWITRDYAAFLTLCRLVYEQAVRKDNEPVLNWYEQVYAAASQFPPAQVREQLMQTCASELSE